MLIICPSCATSYNLQPEVLGVNGRSVRCVRCETVFHAEIPRTQKLLDAAEALGGPVEERGRPAPSKPPVSRHDWAALPEDWNLGNTADADPSEPPADEPHEQSEWVRALAEPPDAPRLSPSGPEAETNALPLLASEEASPGTQLDQGRAPASDAASGNTEFAAIRRPRGAAKRRRFDWPLSHLQSAILALLVLDAVLIGWRRDVVRLLPQTASFYSLIGLPVNLRGLTLESVEVVKEQNDGSPVLMVEGNIVNDGTRALEVPRLKFALRNGSGHEIYSWTAVPQRTILPPHEAIGFRSRLASPPPEGHDVLVRFLHRRDVVAGAR